MDTVPRGWTPGWAATPRASAADVLEQACSHCLTALTCIPAPCPLARQALGRAQAACHTVAATDVKEVVRQCCWCCRCFEVALPAATACGWDLNSLMWTLASHWHGHYGCVCVRVGAMPIERKTHRSGRRLLCGGGAHLNPQQALGGGVLDPPARCATLWGGGRSPPKLSCHPLGGGSAPTPPPQ